MDIFTKGALWDYWKLGSEEIKPTSEETSDLKETNHDDGQEINPDLLTKDIEEFKTYDEYKNDWIYEWNENMPWSGLPVARKKMDIVMDLPGVYIVGNTLCYQDLECYDIADHDQEEREYKNGHEDKERFELFDDHELSVCNIRIFEMIKYSFTGNEEYVAVKEDEYDELMNTSKEAFHANREIFHMMDKGWMDLAESKEIDKVGEVAIIWNPMCDCSHAGIQTHLQYTILAHKLNMENLPSKISGEFLILILFNSPF
ncbi:hypothetical protein Tco_1125639 [Tanacetum coccineum]|uniref:Uncharacterized protein n=1 Tax=Tanacetum coccineum TaxID=301880 RepID=A0ABQ5JDR1_9ASTR